MNLPLSISTFCTQRHGRCYLNNKHHMPFLMPFIIYLTHDQRKAPTTARNSQPQSH